MSSPCRSKGPAKRHHGTTLDSFLKEEGLHDSILAAVLATAQGLNNAGAMDHTTLGEFAQISSSLNP